MITPAAFEKWASGAAAGETICYHTGFLACDRFKMTADGAWVANRPIHTGANRIYRACRLGVVELFQARVGPGKFCYLARRTAA